MKQYTKFLYNWVIKFLWRLYQTFQTHKFFMNRKQRSHLQRTYGNQIVRITKCWKLELWIASAHFLSGYYKRTLYLIFFQNICHKLNSPQLEAHLTLNKKIYVGYKTLDPDRHCKLSLAFMEMSSIFYEVLELMKLYKPRANNRMFTVFFLSLPGRLPTIRLNSRRVYIFTVKTNFNK